MRPATPLPVTPSQSLPTLPNPSASTDWCPRYASGSRPIPGASDETRRNQNPMKFTDLGLIEPLVRAVHDHGYETPTPIQAQAIPAVLKGGDLLAGAQTGTGKTA